MDSFFQCTLSTLTDSQLGKIELLRSGAARLRIGEQTFPLSLGTQAGFRQVCENQFSCQDRVCSRTE